MNSVKYISASLYVNAMTNDIEVKKKLKSGDPNEGPLNKSKSASAAFVKVFKYS